MNGKKIMLAFTSLLTGSFLLIIFLEVSFRFLPVSDSLIVLPVNSENPYFRFKENREVTYSYDYNFSIVTKKRTNNYGFFNDHNYSPEEDTPLLAVIGDSYVEALQVENIASMHGILSEKTKGEGRVYSFGASGSPLSNYLAYADFATKEFKAGALVFIIVANDFDESLTKYRNTPGMHRFSDASDRLELVRQDYQPALIRSFLRPSALARYLAINLQMGPRLMQIMSRPDRDSTKQAFVGNTSSNSNEERIADSRRVIDRFFEELPLQTGLTSDKILFVIDGMRPHLYGPATLEKANGSYFDLMRKYFVMTAANGEYEVVDMQPIFIRESESTGIRFEFPTNGHWNDIGHALVAEEIDKSVVVELFFAQ